MTTSEMITAVRNSTFDTDDTKVLQALNKAQSWVFNSVYTAEGGSDLLATFNEQLTLTSVREYDLGGNLTYSMMGLKRLWVKLPGETTFTPMVERDAADPMFTWQDDVDSTATLSGHPVYYAVENFSQLRFAGLLPSGTILRVDYFRKPPSLDPTVNDELTDGSDLPDIFHEAMVSRATALRFNALDDDRDVLWFGMAKDELAEAIYVPAKRVQRPTETQPFRVRRRII